MATRHVDVVEFSSYNAFYRFVRFRQSRDKGSGEFNRKCASMAPNLELEADYIKDKARKDLLGLLEGVSERRIRAHGNLAEPD